MTLTCLDAPKLCMLSLTETTAGRPGDRKLFETRPNPLPSGVCGRANKPADLGAGVLSTTVVIAIAAGVGSVALLAAGAIWLSLRTPRQPRRMKRADRASARGTSDKETTPALGMAGKQLWRNGAGLVCDLGPVFMWPIADVYSSPLSHQPNAHTASCTLAGRAVL